MRRQELERQIDAAAAGAAEAAGAEERGRAALAACEAQLAAGVLAEARLSLAEAQRCFASGRADASAELHRASAAVAAAEQRATLRAVAEDALRSPPPPPLPTVAPTRVPTVHSLLKLQGGGRATGGGGVGRGARPLGSGSQGARARGRG